MCLHMFNHNERNKGYEFDREQRGDVQEKGCRKKKEWKDDEIIF